MVQSLVYLGALLAALPSARAEFNASSTQNIAVYWGELNRFFPDWNFQLIQCVQVKTRQTKQPLSNACPPTVPVSSRSTQIN